jgi:hypothetical protein
MDPAKALRRLDIFESPYGAHALLDSSMVLFQVIVQKAAGPMTHLFLTRADSAEERRPRRVWRRKKWLPTTLLAGVKYKTAQDL